MVVNVWMAFVSFREADLGSTGAQLFSGNSGTQAAAVDRSRRFSNSGSDVRHHAPAFRSRGDLAGARNNQASASFSCDGVAVYLDVRKLARSAALHVELCRHDAGPGSGG